MKKGFLSTNFKPICAGLIAVAGIAAMTATPNGRLILAVSAAQITEGPKGIAYLLLNRNGPKANQSSYTIK